MFCNNCGNELPDGSRFCDRCGAQVAGGANAYRGANPGYPPPQNYNQGPGGYGAPVQGNRNYGPQGSANGYGGPEQYNTQAPNRGRVQNEQPVPTGIPKTGYAWLLGAQYWIAVIVFLIVGFMSLSSNIDIDDVSDKIAYAVGALSLLALFLDSKEVKRCGYKISVGWIIIAFFGIAGPYLFARAKKTDGRFGPFILWIISVAGAIVMFMGVN